jgi:hypothetical protein
MNKLEIYNIVMLFVSLILAFVLPFDLFLFAYAVLGPLHYLTEIRWLHNKNYFTTASVSPFVFVVCMSIGVGALFSSSLTVSNFLLIALFLVSLLLVFPKNTYVWVSVLGLLCVSFSYSMSPVVLLLGVLIPTLIHVYFFTLVFMIQGALKNKHIVYWVAPILHMSFGLLCVYGSFGGYFASSVYAQNVFLNQYFGFSETFIQIGSSFFGSLQNVQQLFSSPEGLAISRLFAFAYTYHYLNWFIKTRIIGWGNIPRRTFIIILVLWLFSLFIYSFDYIAGMAVLAFLSVLHVLLEFPLNIRALRSFFPSSTKI